MTTHGHKERILKILFTLVEMEHRYTKRELAEKFEVDTRTISNAFIDLVNVGLKLQKDDRDRYGLEKDKKYKYLKNLLIFSDEDRALLVRAIDSIDKGKGGEKLKRKLDSLYNYQGLGYESLRRPYLSKIDKLEEAKAKKKIVTLVDYHSSNSNSIKSRSIEAFHIQPDADTVQGYEAAEKSLKHFRISRIKRVVVTEDPWQHENHHVIRKTDPFGIVSDDQVRCHLRFKIGARNELLERFPNTRAYLRDAEEENTFDFACEVNDKFYGIANFILGNHHHIIEILAPDHLADHLQHQIKNMKFLKNS